MKRKLRAIASDKGMRKVARESAKVVWGRRVPMVQKRVPVRTGRLKDSVRMRVTVSPKKENILLSLLVGGVFIRGKPVGYAGFVHETHKTHSKFLESVIRESAATVARELATEIRIRDGGLLNPGVGLR